MVQPSGGGAVLCMKNALDGINVPVNYVNVHGTSTPVGDIRETRGAKNCIGDHIPTISSTKSLTGHSLGNRCTRIHIFYFNDEK